MPEPTLRQHFEDMKRQAYADVKPGTQQYVDMLQCFMAGAMIVATAKDPESFMPEVMAYGLDIKNIQVIKINTVN